MSTTATTTEAIAGQDWTSRWVSAEGTFDPSYERTNAALRRWVDGMEQALLTGASARRAGLSRGLTLNQTPHRR
jgi:hypothetical protein